MYQLCPPSPPPPTSREPLKVEKGTFSQSSMGLQTFPAPATFASFPLAGFEPLSPHGSAAPPLLSAASPPAVSPPEVSARKTGARPRHLSRGGVEGKASRHPGDANVPTVPARRRGGAGPRGGFRRSGRVAFATFQACGGSPVASGMQLLLGKARVSRLISCAPSFSSPDLRERGSSAPIEPFVAVEQASSIDSSGNLNAAVNTRSKL